MAEEEKWSIDGVTYLITKSRFGESYDFGIHEPDGSHIINCDSKNKAYRMLYNSGVRTAGHSDDYGVFLKRIQIAREDVLSIDYITLIQQVNKYREACLHLHNLKAHLPPCNGFEMKVARGIHDETTKAVFDVLNE